MNSGRLLVCMTLALVTTAAPAVGQEVDFRITMLVGLTKMRPDVSGVRVACTVGRTDTGAVLDPWHHTDVPLNSNHEYAGEISVDIFAPDMTNEDKLAQDNYLCRLEIAGPDGVFNSTLPGAQPTDPWMMTTGFARTSSQGVIGG